MTIVIIIAYGVLIGILVNVLSNRRKDFKKYVTLLKSEDFATIKNKSQLIDTRKSEDFKQAKVISARNIPIATFKTIDTKLFKDKPVYLYSYNGFKAKQASRKLIKNGFKKIIILNDKFENYPKKFIK